MSLDGFMTGRPNRPPRIRWVSAACGSSRGFWRATTRANREVQETAAAGIGAFITGRRTYDDSLPWWGADGPGGAARSPVFVVTHEAPAQSPDNGVYTFVTDGIESAVEQAKAAADGMTIGSGGANIGQQLIQAGLLDELRIHVVPVLFGAGTSMFAGLEDRHIELEPIEVIHTSGAIHMRFEIVRN